MGKKVLIVGHTGYLGSRLVPYLAAVGYEVGGIDLGYFQSGQIHPCDDHTISKKSAADITTEDIRGFDVVIQLAGLSNDPIGTFDPEKFYQPTVEYTLKIAAICRDLGARFIFPSSCSVYGFSEKLLNEQSQVNPKTFYSQNKIDIENGLQELSSSQFSPIALRFATIFGPSPRIRFDVVINMLVGMATSKNEIVLNSNGLAWRPHLYIDDACSAIRSCIDWDYNGPDLMTLNVGRDDNNWQILAVAKYISERFGHIPIRFLSPDTKKDDLVVDRKITDGVDKRNYQVSFAKIESTLPSFRCQTSVKEGINELILWFEKYEIDLTKFSQREFYRLQQMEFLQRHDFLNG